VKVGVWCAVSARRVVGSALFNEKKMPKIYTGYSRAILSRVNRRRKTLRLVSARLSYCPPHVLYVYAGFALRLRGQNYQQ
jgi:hypothetical protein